MYQVKFGVDEKHRGWLLSLYDSLRPFVTDCGGLLIEGEEKGRRCLSVAMEIHPSRGKKQIKSELCNLFLTRVKREYLQEAIGVCGQNEYLFRIYVHILVGLNREEEIAILREELPIVNHFSLDGFYRFRMDKIRKKWDELVALSIENGDLLQEDNSFSLLLRYMLSCLPCKTDFVSVDFDGQKYQVKTNRLIGVAEKPEDVVMMLVDLAPGRVELSPKATLTELDDKILGIFDASFV